MTPKYSILYYKQNLDSHISDIKEYLYGGIKVFWFGMPQDKKVLKESFEPFMEEYFLQVFDITDVCDMNPCIVYDGKNINSDNKVLIDTLEESVLSFNAAQYRVEHCAADANIVVKASAGTGKTTVMIDRILYLMHMVPELTMSEIYMITFTNEATNQMNDRLQERLLKKYALTKNKRYLSWLEQQSQMHISTIDSLAYDLFKKYGAGVGFGRDLQILPMEKDRKDLIKDILSDELSDSNAIVSQIGMSYSEASRLIDDYWKEFTMKGYTPSEIVNRDWGDEDDKEIAGMQRIMKAVLSQFEEKYKQVKLDANAISINDLFFDFGHYLLDGRVNCDGLDMKYLFVDEFQDTDANQIKTFAKLVKDMGVHLFVVGDVKQSIYGFKGATDAAFDILDKKMDSKLSYFSLRNNYRTCSNIMKSMEKYFFSWSEDGLLKYEDSVRPFNTNIGKVEMDIVENKNDVDQSTLYAIDEALEALEMDIKSGRKKNDSKAKVAVLVRGTKRAEYIAKLCRKHGKTVVLNSDSDFYLSRAVRDFYALISSYIFVDKPVYMFNYLMTPYAHYSKPIDVFALEELGGDERSIVKYLKQYMAETKWMEYQKEFRLRPVLSVIKDIVENENLIENYIAQDKARLYNTGMTEAGRNRQAVIDAERYRLNLDKLMEIIQQRIDGEFATLYDLYIFLTLMIATNRDEKEPDLHMEDDYRSVYIMTVHKSKGLEFDTVIMSYMNHGLSPQIKTNIFVNDEKVAWYYKRDNNNNISSIWYDELWKEFEKKTIEEETRILYVAMTRAINKLVLLVNNWDYLSWSTLIRKVGLTNE